MKEKATAIYRMLAIVCVLGLTGCEKTVDDIEKWKSKGQTEKLIGALDNDAREMRMAAAKALGELKAESAVEPLAELFSIPDSQLATTAVEALISIGNQSAENQLITALNLKDRRTCTTAILGLGSLKSSQAVDPLIHALNDGDAEIATAAATALGLIGDERSIGPLVAQLQARSFSLRLACVKSLGSIGGQASTEALTIALSDINKDIRQIAIELFVATGEQATPYALATLRDSNAQARLSAISILTAINAVPNEGNDFAWYLLAQVSTGKRAVIKTTTVDQLTQMGTDATEALLEAAAHDELNIREHAFRALENIGEPCVAQAIEAANEYATPAGRQWFADRSSWQGAPSWRIDLWGAATALDPDFKLRRATLASLRSVSNKSQVAREYNPLLVNQLGNQKKGLLQTRTVDLFGSDSAEVLEEIDPRMARIQLIAAGDRAVFPLIAALDARDQQVADACAEILGEIGDERATPPLTEALARKVAAGDELSNSPFYTALQKLNAPDAEPIFLKIRPNAAHATRIFERQYKGRRVTKAITHNAEAAYSQPIAFTLSHIKDGKEGETRMIFKKDGSGDWVPTPPLPAELTL